MEFIANPGRVVNRDGKQYIADAKGLIIADTQEIQSLFIAYGFKKVGGEIISTTKVKSLRDEYIEVFSKKPGNMSEEKMKEKILATKTK